MRSLFTISIVILGFSQAFGQGAPKTSQPTGELVFSTGLFTGRGSIRHSNKIYKIDVRTYINEDEEDGPADQISIVRFSPEALPELVVHGEVVGYASSDINKDGSEEFITLTSENGNWYLVQVHSLIKCSASSALQWYQPMDGFLWWPGFRGEEGCDAEIYWLPATRQVKVVTSNADDEDFSCTDVSLHKWK